MAKKKKSLSLEDSTLKDTHELFDKYFEEWRFLNAAYEGIRALIAYGAMYQHERESEVNYIRRQKVAYGFGYSKSVVDIFNSYLFKKEFPKEIPKALANDEQWIAFQKDCNLEGSTFNDFFVDEQRNASILGHMGLLVDKPAKDTENRADEKEKNVYPYVVAYKPMAILDWSYQRDETGRRVLSYLKVQDDDGQYRVWTRERWEIYELEAASGDKDSKVNLKAVMAIGEQKTQAEITGKGVTAKLIDSGDNELGEIPWIWLFNQRSNIDKEVGISDIVDVARIDASIIRNLSQIEEIIDYGAFPMMRKPMPEAGAGSAPAADEVGVTAVLEFDPEHPESKPDWLNSVVEGPVNAVLKLIAAKVGEIYRASNIGGMTATEISKSAKSGIALKTEFQLLNSKLVKKGKNVTNAKAKITEYWLKWQDDWDKYKDDIKYNHITSFEVEDLANDLENILTSTVMVVSSPGYKKEIQKIIVRMVLPTVDEKILADIDKEIEENVDKDVEDEVKAKALFYGQGAEPPPGDVGEELDEEGNPIEKGNQPTVSKKGKVVNMPAKK